MRAWMTRQQSNASLIAVTGTAWILFSTAGCGNDYILDIDFGLDEIRVGNAVCPDPSMNRIGAVLSVTFQGDDWATHLSGLSNGPVLRVTLDPVASGASDPTTPVASPTIELCAPISVAPDGTASIPESFNVTHILPTGADASEVFASTAIYDTTIAANGTCNPVSTGLPPLGGTLQTYRLPVDNCERRLLEIPLTSVSSAWEFDLPGPPADGDFWDVWDFRYDYSSEVRVVWPPPTGDPIIGAQPAGPVQPPDPGGTRLGSDDINITVLAEGYTASDLATIFWPDVARAVTGRLAGNYVFGSSSVRNNIRIRAIPAESYISFEGFENTLREWRIFNTINDTNNRVDSVLNYVRINRVIDRSGVQTDYVLLLVNDKSCAGWAWVRDHDNGIIDELDRDGFALVTGACRPAVLMELTHTIASLHDERDLGSRSWYGPNSAECRAIADLPSSFTSTTWGRYMTHPDNCPAGNGGTDQNCHVAAFSVGTRNVSTGGEDVMFPEQTCGMSFNGGTPFCRVCTHTLLAEIRRQIGQPQSFDDIMSEVLAAKPMGMPFPTGQTALTCP